jgi:hypothetical protein
MSACVVAAVLLAPGAGAKKRALSGLTDGPGTRAAALVASPAYGRGTPTSTAEGRAYNWTREYKRRWLLERRNGVLRARTVRRLRRQLAALRPPPLGPQWLVNAFLCIHRGEGAWNANTGNGYYGGLQMDWSFMRAYGGSLLAAKGTADKWTPGEQIRVAMRAYHSGRGFYPWPNTARACGLI